MKKSTLIGQAAKKTITLPFNLVATKGLKKDLGFYGKNLGLLQKTDFYCPMCIDGKLHYLAKDTSNEQQNQQTDADGSCVWGCSHCGFEIATKSSDPKEVKEQLRAHGAAWYRESKKKGHHLTSQERKQGVDGLVFQSQVFAGLAVVLLPFCFIYMQNASVLTVLTAIMFIMVLVLYALSRSFAAWKLHNDQLFSADPQKTFELWLKQPNVFCRPKKIVAIKRHKHD